MTNWRVIDEWPPQEMAIPKKPKTICKYDGHCLYWQTCLCGSEVSAQERRNEKYDFSHIHSVERG